MRSQLAAFATLAIVGSGVVAAAPSQAAAPARVSGLTVSASLTQNGTSKVSAAWTGVDSSADGVLVCVRRGVTTPSTPTGCESRVAVPTPKMSSGPITIYPAKTYTIAVYAYHASTPEPVYSAPVSVIRHGTTLTFHENCSGQAPGDRCQITGLLKDVYLHVALAHRSVELWTAGMQKNASWSRLQRVTTDQAGQVRTTITLDHSRLYQLRYVTVGAHELTTYTARYGIVVSG